ncbi:NAD(P)H-binding protein [Paenibacillus pedocola]|uniref:NAD(P)H-binding protein n=1 Tax=Paenibacillus pedocola TaxID=3242193 RepID=UPI002877B401|nr:NAD(P)H-binding protein [Paenibacillus typhae]
MNTPGTAKEVTTENRPEPVIGSEGTGRRASIALTGASGYIGHNLLKLLTGDYDVIALSRHGNQKENRPNVEWRSCELFSMSSAEQALQGADYAIYLVHSMLPSAKLTQAAFEDMDAILADNFARAARKNGIKQIVYLSGIIPGNIPQEQLSRHLRSRLEVERILGSYGVPVTTIRAGLIVGPQGSSFPILVKLVRRLPVMLLPKWTRTATQPIALSEVLLALRKCIGSAELYGRAIDVGGPGSMTYKEMMLKTAEVLHKRRRLFDIPLLTIHLSRLWVTLITGAPKEMAYPLIESLTHPMVVHPARTVPGISDGRIPFDEAAREALKAEDEAARRPKGKSTAPAKSNSGSKSKKAADVRSIQRVVLPGNTNTDWAARYYLEWLGRTLKPLVRIDYDGRNIYRVHLRASRKPILELTYLPERSSAESTVYQISGGAFTKKGDPHEGRLEFLQIPGTRECVIAIHDYLPSLPWFLYKYTQAKAHLWVMAAFRRHLQRLGSKS